ncbi:cadmium-translocating P-type ATPase [Myxococcota bacterium]|nr:cadmium-translocating P-type ATPase [Myxococcota bacterium]MBU1431839.1 cadmium-translocating P-type ATPase [Myxococcota bacterium]MBU1899349.1 cadmium-translocating P-type ATPase [Myxococcota bacterium]
MTDGHDPERGVAPSEAAPKKSCCGGGHHEAHHEAKETPSEAAPKKSCCGGGHHKAKETPSEVTPSEVTPKKSCCGGGAKAGLPPSVGRKTPPEDDPQAPSRPCTYCGKPVYGVAEDSAEAFCCGGCLNAYRMQRGQAPTLAAAPCAHCGREVKAPASTPAFCGPSCQDAWNLKQNKGLGEFYTLRDKLGSACAQPLPASAKASGRYGHYDDPGFLARFASEGRHIELHLEGVHCAACVWVLDQLPKVCPGVEASALDYGRKRLSLRWDPQATPLSAVAEFIHQLGYPSSPIGVEAEKIRKAASRSEILRLGVMFALAGNVMLIAAALYAGADKDPSYKRFLEWISLGLAIPAVTYGAMPYYRGALSGIRMRVPHIDLPIALGVLGGFFASLYATISGHGEIYYDSVTMLVFLLLIGRFIQSRSQRAAMSRAELLAVLTPGSAERWDGERFVQVPAATLRAGDRVRVHSGESVPVDGALLSGEAHLDMSLLTGESRPVALKPGAEVFAGTVSVGDLFELEAKASGAETRLGRLVQLIEQAALDRAPVMRLADRISGYFVVAVISIATLGGIAWAFIDPTRIFDVVVSMLVVSCPCALGLATPMALGVARGRAAGRGILIRSASALERLGRITKVVFDKTGTLTEGRLEVSGVDLRPIEGVDEASLKAAIGALEASSAHPIARAIARWAGQGGGISLEGVEETAGRGMSARWAGRLLEIGAPGALGYGEFDLMGAAARGESPVSVRLDGQVVGLIRLSDQIRPETPAALARLREMGISIGVLSGDHPELVAQVAAGLGIEDALGGQSPEDKAKAVAGQAEWAMVGDGFNDAAALRAASVGLAVHGGAEVALQVADVWLVEQGPSAVVDAVEGGRRALGLIRRNLTFSLIYNLIFATLALLGYIDPLAAAIIMPISSITVVSASMLGRTFTPR